MPTLLYRRWGRVAFVAACALSLGAPAGSAQDDTGRHLSSPADVLARARAEQIEKLHLRIGRFASGEAVVYRGELDVTERRRAPYVRRLPRGRVVASLIRLQDLPSRSGSRVTLTIVSAEHDLWLRLGQSSDHPGVTRASLLHPTRATASLTTSCTGCLVDLASQPRALAFRGFASTGRLGAAPGTPVRVEVSGWLERVELADLRLADVESLSPGFEAFLEGEDQAFVQNGDEGTQRVEGEIRELVETPVGLPPQARCERVTRYSAERFVELANLDHFGVRDLAVLGAEICCFDHGGHGDGEVCTEEVDP